uniref:Uncharacterized protein n=1 Tax=Trichogramma kaykai TaxID=54128 RepID=A0ABD2WL49_9HYME
MLYFACYCNFSKKVIALQCPGHRGTTFKKSEFLPVIAKCCNSNEVLIPSEHEKMQCIKWNSTIFFEPIFYNFNKTGILSSGSRYKNVNTIIGTPCSSER